jgi:hypothetical protein
MPLMHGLTSPVLGNGSRWCENAGYYPCREAPHERVSIFRTQIMLLD